MVTPTIDIELYDDATLTDPTEAFRALREAGSTVWLERYAMFAHPRFDACRAALRDWRTYSSAQGVMMNDTMNDTLKGILLCADGDDHAAMRKVIAAPLTPHALGDVKAEITGEADELVERLVAQGTFDAATELAHHLPMTIVSRHVGLPEAGRERMIEWAHANFDCFGPMNARTEAAFPVVDEMVRYAFSECTPEKLTPDGWAAGIWAAAARGDIPADKPPLMMNDYMGPSLDTTIFAIGSMIRLFSEHPDQWSLLRSRPELVLNAINEVLRLETVITGFSRVLTEDHTVDGVTMPEGSRVLVLYSSANRDERHFPDPDAFDITRSNAGEHLGLGFGTHSCPGGNLARMEMRALLEAFLARVERFELVEVSPKLNNVLHGLGRCVVTVHGTAART
jgi:cytochrome P450